ncbi:MAG TPA: hypothetical protein VLH19_01310 [Patescibacteria group bacterium]|nr:hypothetical protein [Patescibacteria group bacterium]
MPDVFNAEDKEPKRSRVQNLKKSVAASEALQNAQERGGSRLSAFCAMPESVEFDIQHADEPVLMLLRQHPIVNVPWIVITIFLVLLPIVLPVFSFISFLPANFRFVSVLGWYLFVFGYAIQNFVLWFYNVYLITDERIIDIDFFSLIFKHISEAKIEHIQDITFTNTNLAQSLFDYGDVRIQTAAEIPQLDFEKVPHPDLVSKFLSEMMDQEEQEKLDGRVR